MSDFALYLGMIAAGYLAGAFLRRSQRRISWVDGALTAVVMLLVFTMGLRVGANEEVVASLNLIGLYALVFTIVVLAFTGAGLSLVRRLMGVDRYGMVRSAPTARGRRKSETDAGGVDDPDCSRHENSESAKTRIIDKMTWLILAAVACGLLTGLAILRFSAIEFSALNDAAAMVIRVGLCVLLVLIGLDLGKEGTVMRNIRDAGLRILAVPATVIVATLAASATCSLFLPVSLRECLAIGAGFGWYSLAPGIIMDQGYVTAGAISFLHNILRELISILVIPIVARHVGYLECSGLGGATSMDVGLPIVEQSTNGITAVYAFVSGAVLSLLVPVLVPLVLAL